MNKTKNLIIVGDSSFAEVAYEYFQFDSDYNVVAFSVESAYLKKTSLMQLPVVPLENLPQLFNPEDYYVYVAVVYSQLNQLRTRLYQKIKQLNYKLASYISKHAFIWKNVEIGEHCFIFENNVIQPFVKIGANNVLWSGNHIGHHSNIGNNCFISSHVVISGHCQINDNCFFGVNSTLADRVTIAEDCVIGAGATLFKNTEPGLIYKSKHTEIASISSYQLFKIKPLETAHE